MCGWAGFWTESGSDRPELHHLAQVMAATLAHRGPDDADSWADERAGLALGFRRLAIVDLSPHGRQPMISASGRYVIVFNGEVYNFATLRIQLEPLGHRFNGRSDTEVMLAAIEQWGLHSAVERFVGMFAFALWDRSTRQLSLVRDRLGIKPLYYATSGGTLLFGSELKALRAHPDFTPNIDRGALALFLRHGYIPAPYSIYRNTHKLPPGHILTLTAPSDNATSSAYWSLKQVAEHGATIPFQGSAGEAIEQLDALLREAVRLRMIADVPLGAFLSGGIDSSTVVALMQDQSQQPVKTFSIGFREENFNEAVYARAVAKHLGTAHTELYVTHAEAQTVIPHLPAMYDEPFADASQIPTFLVSRLARSHVTVSLSGDGGDELFAGYKQYLSAAALWQHIHWLMPAARRRVSASIRSPIVRRLAPKLGGEHFAQRLSRLAEVLQATGSQSLYHRFVSHWLDPASVVGATEPLTVMTNPDAWLNNASMQNQMMYVDSMLYLPDDILTKVDRASMAVSLEARVPLLDHRVVEFAWRLPLHYKLHKGQSKWILRQVLGRYLPHTLIDRPKQGFGVPVSSWLRGPLRAWAEELLDERRLRDEGFFDPAAIRSRWAEHLRGQSDWGSSLWAVAMFQAWHEEWGTHSREQQAFTHLDTVS